MSNNQDASIKVSFNGNIENSNIINAGGNVSSTINSNVNKEKNEVRNIFEPIYTQIQNRPEDPNVEKTEIINIVENIETEIQKNESANNEKINRWLKFLSDMAPDVFDVMVKTLLNPVSGITDVVKKILERAYQSKG